MNLIKAMRSFSVIAEEGSFAGAARLLRQSPPAVTRDLALLEQHLGCQLIIRTTRQLRLTAEGATFLDDIRRILADLTEAEANVRGARGRIEGPIRLTAPVQFGRMHVAPLALSFTREHPGINLAFMLNDRVVDLVEDSIDIAVRIAVLPDSSLQAIRVGSVRRVFCAAPAYLERFGTPESRQELNRHSIVEILGSSTPLSAANPGANVRPAVATIAANSVDVALMAAEQGFGIVQALSYQVSEAVAAGRLRVVLPGHDADPVPVSIVHAAGHRLPGRIRAMIDFLAEGLRAKLSAPF